MSSLEHAYETIARAFIEATEDDDMSETDTIAWLDEYVVPSILAHIEDLKPKYPPRRIGLLDPEWVRDMRQRDEDYCK